MRGAPSEESIAQGFSDPNAKMLQRVRKTNAVQRKDKELRGSSNGVISGYHKWLKARMQGITWLPKLKISSGEETEVPEESEEVQALKAELERKRVVKEKFKTTTIRIRKECDKLRDVNMAIAEALERETKRSQKEEWGRNKL